MRCMVAVSYTHLGLIALGQVGDEVVGVGDLGRPDAVLVRGLQPPVADVLHHRAGEEVGILQDGAERAAQVVLPDVPDIDAVVGLSLIHILQISVTNLSGSLVTP